MPRYDLHLTTVVQQLDHGVLAEALFFPELSCLRDDRGSARKELLKRIRRFAKTLPRQELPRRQAPAGATVRWCEVIVRPPRRSPAWQSPIRLKFPVVEWRHSSDGQYLAYVPPLRIDVIAATEDERNAELKHEILSALKRNDALDSLQSLVHQQWTRRSGARPVILPVELPTLKQSLQDEKKRQQRNKPSELKKVATELPELSPERVYEVTEPIDRLAELLLGEQPQSVLLVGPSGVGKTALVREFSRRLSLRATREQSVWTTTGARIISGMSGFGMWEERCHKVCREAIALHAILHVGSLPELMEVGKSEHAGIGVAGYLRPYLARRELLAIAECTPEQLPVIERQQPQLLAAFHRLQIPEPSPEQGLRLLELASGDFRPPGGVPAYEQSGPPWISSDALRTLDLLHRRYATYSAYPGRPLRFLRHVLRDTFPFVARDGTDPVPINARQPGPITPGDVTRAFARETGLPLFLLDANVPFAPESTRAWFQQRVLGQPSVVDLVVDLLGVVKTGLARPGKPLASLLFIGPTGVGKTEMSKAVAHFLFGDAQRLVRFDMSEFQDRLAVQRLIGGITGTEGLLTARIREQPFSVLLFDEVEKAHPQFFDFLLQVLGEARLTDAGGRLADFRNAVIVMTSNLGVASFQQGAVGFQRSGNARQQAAEHFTAEVSRFVRPELFNRIDRIVPFLPLDEDCIREIARGQLRDLELRDGIAARGVRMIVRPGVAEWLASRGYDVRYGARPLKRAIERELLAPLAVGINRYSADRALEATIEVVDGTLRVHVRAQSDTHGRPVSSVVAQPQLAQTSGRTVHLRRYVQRLEQSPEVQAWRDTQFRLQRQQELIARRARKMKVPLYVAAQGQDARALAQLSELKTRLERLETLSADSRLLEELSLRHLYGDAASPDSGVESELDVLYADVSKRFEQFVMDTYADSLRVSNGVDCLTLALYARNRQYLFEMLRIYTGLLAARGHAFQVYELRTEIPEQDRDAWFKIPKIPQAAAVAGSSVAAGESATSSGKAKSYNYYSAPVELLRNPPTEATAGLVGLIITADDVLVQGRLGPEAGLHLFYEPNGSVHEVLVDASACPIEDYRPPDGVEYSWTLARTSKLRKYEPYLQAVEDLQFRERVSFSGSDVLQAVLEITERRLRLQAYRLVLDLDPLC